MNYSELNADLTPEELIRLRYAALEEQSYSLLYASYHPQAPFIEQFPDVTAYLDFAAQSLAGMRLCEAYVGASRTTSEGVELICAIRFEMGAGMQTMYELALVRQTEVGWRYHSAQKLSGEDYQGEFAALDFIHFDRQSPKIRF
jgi:SEC-C motif-containing protein